MPPVWVFRMVIKGRALGGIAICIIIISLGLEIGFFRAIPMVIKIWELSRFSGLLGPLRRGWAHRGMIIVPA
jgi:hypothetical protein